VGRAPLHAGQEVEALLPGALRVGDSFTLYGRNWEVVGEIPPPRTEPHKPPRLLCTKSEPGRTGD
jgi:hypothetical protein